MSSRHIRGGISICNIILPPSLAIIFCEGHSRKAEIIYFSRDLKVGPSQDTGLKKGVKQEMLHSHTSIFQTRSPALFLVTVPVSI